MTSASPSPGRSRRVVRSVVIYGGGIAGAILARQLSPVAEVMLVDPLDYFEVPMAAPRNLVRPEFAQRSIVTFAQALPNVAHVQGRLIELSHAGGVIQSPMGELWLPQPDLTVLATGSRYANALLRGTEGAGEGRKAFYAHYSRRIADARRIVIVGGGPAGVEVAGEIADAHRDKHIVIIEAGPRILAGTSAQAAAHAGAWLQGRGVVVHTGERLLEGGADPSDVFAPGGTAVTSAGRRIPYDLMIWCTGGRPNTDYLRQHFASCLDARGRVMVTPELQVVGSPSLYALGDITDLDENKMAWHIAGQVRTAAANIRCALAGKGRRLKQYRPQTGNPAMVVTMGSKAGVAHLSGVGVVKAGWLVSLFKARHMLVPKYRAALGM